MPFRGMGLGMLEAQWEGQQCLSKCTGVEEDKSAEMRNYLLLSLSLSSTFGPFYFSSVKNLGWSLSRYKIIYVTCFSGSCVTESNILTLIFALQIFRN